MYPIQEPSLIRHDLFGLTHTPFITAPPKPYLDDNRKQGLNKLEAFLQTRGFAAIAGRPGNGKTGLVRYFVESRHQPSHKILYIPFCHLSDNDLLRAICMRFDIVVPFGKNKTIAAIQQRIDDIQPVNPIIVFDEMQNALPKSMDVIRMLANNHFERVNKISCILIGTNEFFDKLRLAINESLRQRITCFHIIGELDENATNDYICYCLAQAGAQHQIVEPPAVKLIYDISAGTIRIINKLVAAAMAYASTKESSAVLLDHVQEVTDQCILPKRNLTQ
jgi:type II secretory pathway predicted ATPase ExeA